MDVEALVTAVRTDVLVSDICFQKNINSEIQ
jgi:hypothetical protein